jgi:denticleless
MVPSSREWSPAYTCAFSHSAKDAWTASEHSFAAIATECGGVRVFDTRKSDANIPEGWEAGERIGSTSRTSTAPTGEKQQQTGPKAGLFAPHANAIYDIKWSADDTMLTTACADQSTGIWDTSRTSASYEQSAKNDGLITKLRGHMASVKTSIWHDRSTLCGPTSPKIRS